MARKSEEEWWVGKPLKVGDRVGFNQFAHERNVASKRAKIGTVLTVDNVGNPPLAMFAKVKWDELKTPAIYATCFLELAK